jgi:hypothetical protein
MDRLASQLDPHGKLVAPGEAAVNPLNLAGVDQHHRLGLDEHIAAGSRCLGRAVPDLDLQATLTGGLETVEAGLGEIDSRGWAVDTRRRMVELALRDLDDDPALGQEQNRAVTP